MFSIVVCPSCGRKRIIDAGCETSACPYCNTNRKVCELRILFSDRDQSVVRDVLNGIDSSKYPEPRKKSGNDPDPASTLVYEYEHTAGTIEKLSVLARGLTAMFGEFTEKEVDELFPCKGKQMVKNMISADVVIETRHGRYRSL